MKKYETPTIDLRHLQAATFLGTSKDAVAEDIFDGDFGKHFNSFT